MTNQMNEIGYTLQMSNGCVGLVFIAFALVHGALVVIKIFLK